MSAESILIVEDEPALLRGLKDNFEAAGYVVAVATDGDRAIHTARRIRPDLILLDIMLPGMNGYEICRSLREDGLDMPIIMLTAKNQESDIVLGLNLGADDYVTKPFGIRELLARARAFLRRRRPEEATAYSFGDFTLETTSRKLLKKGREVILAPKEFGLLEYLVQNAGRALTRDRLLNAVWGHDILVTARSVDRCVNTLRAKIEKKPDAPVFIKTVRAIGYRFDLPE